MTQKKIRINKTKTDSSNKLEHKQGRQGILNKQRSRIRNEQFIAIDSMQIQISTCIHQSPQQLYLDKSKYSEVVENKSKAIFFKSKTTDFQRILSNNLYQQTTTYLLANDKVCHQFKNPLKHNNRRQGFPAYFVKVKKKNLECKTLCQTVIFVIVFKICFHFCLFTFFLCL